jgi:hypothetical protein
VTDGHHERETVVDTVEETVTATPGTVGTVEMVETGKECRTAVGAGIAWRGGLTTVTLTAVTAEVNRLGGDSEGVTERVVEKEVGEMRRQERDQHAMVMLVANGILQSIAPCTSGAHLGRVGGTRLSTRDRTGGSGHAASKCTRVCFVWDAPRVCSKEWRFWAYVHTR